MSKQEIFRPSMDNLEKEWLSQPELTHSLARKAADTRNNMDVAKAKMELVEAELKIKIKKKPYNYGFSDKRDPAQATIDSAAIKNEKYQAAQSAYLKAKHEHSIAEAACSAASVKKTALENLVILWMRDYGAAPKVAEEYREGVSQKMRDKSFKGFNVDDPVPKKKKKGKR